MYVYNVYICKLYVCVYVLYSARAVVGLTAGVSLAPPQPLSKRDILLLCHEHHHYHPGTSPWPRLIGLVCVCVRPGPSVSPPSRLVPSCRRRVSRLFL